MGELAVLIGALVPTFLMSRLFLWLTKRWSWTGRLLSVHLVSGVLACILSALGNAGGSMNWGSSFIYVGAQLVWFGVDVFRYHSKTVQISS